MLLAAMKAGMTDVVTLGNHIVGIDTEGNCNFHEMEIVKMYVGFRRSACSKTGLDFYWCPSRSSFNTIIFIPRL